MIEIHAVSPENEMPAAHRLATLLTSAWPDIAESARDRIDILVGVRTPVDVDLLVIVRLDRPREIPPQPRRLGGMSTATTIQNAVFAIEVKELDESRFSRIGNQLFPIYEGISERSASKQAFDAALGVSKFARQYGQNPFVHALAWLTEYDDNGLRDIEALVVGRNVTWLGMLDAAAQQHAFQIDPTKTQSQLMVLRQILLNRRTESRRDRARVERLSRDLVTQAAVDALVAKAGSAQIRLIGRGGSGKTTSLALLAVSLAEAGQRVLILTFHLTLRSDIAHLIASLGRQAAIPSDRVLVETTMSFVLSALEGLGGTVPLRGTSPDYDALDGVLDETRSMLVDDTLSGPGDVTRLRTANPERFAWDHVFIDESQDCSDGERDFLRALYGHRRLVLADGVDQLVRRQFACDWNTGVPEDERVVHRLDKSLRMLRNVALFVNAFAHTLDFPTWRIAPQEDLPGGRVIVAVGDVDAEDLLAAIARAAAVQKADPADCLICLPPRAANDDGARVRLLAAGEKIGLPLWDGTLASTRASATAGNDALRLVRYESCRGLEGWITVALDIDDFVANKLRHPNPSPHDPPIDSEIIANRWMLIPLTRAVHTLVITVRDPNSDVAARLAAAVDDPAMPGGVVEWVDAKSLGKTLAATVATV